MQERRILLVARGLGGFHQLLAKHDSVLRSGAWAILNHYFEAGAAMGPSGATVAAAFLKSRSSIGSAQ